jgi:VWFA-related protein
MRAQASFHRHVRLLANVGLLVCVAAVARTGAQQASPPPSPLFRTVTELVTIDVIVRGRDGAIVRGLTAEEFEITEDGTPQELLTLGFEEVDAHVAPRDTVDLLAGVEGRVLDGTAASAGPRVAAGREPVPGYAGRRLMVLLFDLSSMEAEQVQRGVDAAVTYVQKQMASGDLVAVATVSSQLDVLSDFTDDRSVLLTTLGRLGASHGMALPAVEVPPTVGVAADPVAADAANGFEHFNDDVRLRALRVLAETLAPIAQKKAVLFFSAGMSHDGWDNQVELRAATNAAVRANVAIYAVDTRGLQTVVPGGSARVASQGGQGLFSGRNVWRQFDELASSQETLVSLSSDTGGRAFINTNDLAGAFTRVQRDTAAYYMLGYSSTNAIRDGRFRRIEVRVRRPGLQIEARKGYFAARDFAHTGRLDREAQLREELDAAVSSTALPVILSSGWFRLADDRYYVPLALAVPGSALAAHGDGRVSVDVLGQVHDEQGRPVGRLRETVQLPAGSIGPLATRQFLYQSGVTLPPGRFSVKVVVRENTNGTVGSFEAPLLVPELKHAPLKLSSVVLSTRLEPWTRGRTESPLVRDGMQLLPNLTHVVDGSQRMYVYYEVYDPAAGDATPHLRTSLAFYRGSVKVFETPIVERTAVDDANRKASIFQFALEPGSVPPGLYTCQVNIIAAVGGAFAFPRMTLVVR